MTSQQQLGQVSFASLGMTYQRAPQPLYDFPFQLEKLTICSGVLMTLLCAIFAVRTGKANRLMNTPLNLLISVFIAFIATIFVFCALIISGKVL